MVTPYMDQLRLGVELAGSRSTPAGGILGRRIEFVYRNDLGSPPSVASVASLITNEGCEAIVSGFVQASRASSRSGALRRFRSSPASGPKALIADRSQSSSPPRRCRSCLPFAPGSPTSSRPAIHHYQLDALGPGCVDVSLWSGRRRSHRGCPGHDPVQGAHAGDFRGVIRWAHDMESNIIWTGEPRPYSVNVVNQAIELGFAEGKTSPILISASCRPRSSFLAPRSLPASPSCRPTRARKCRISWRGSMPCPAARL